MKKVLLTGIAGFIGAHTLEHIMETTDWGVVGVDSFEHGGKMERLNQVFRKNNRWQDRTRLLVHDLTKPFSLIQLEKIGEIDYVINMASESHVDRSISDPVPFIRNNIELTVQMLEYARYAKPEKFIQISTDEVYGPLVEAQRPFKEWQRFLPSNPYSASKAAQEMIAISYWRTYNVPLIITNTMNNIGEMQDVEKFLPMLIRDINEGAEVQIHADGEKIGSRFYLHARNHADALTFILRMFKPKKYVEGGNLFPNKFNVVGEDRLDNLELAQKVAGLLNKDLKYKLAEFHSTRPGHDMHYGLDGSRLKDWGWKPPLDFEESLKRTVDNYMENKQWLK